MDGKKGTIAGNSASAPARGYTHDYYLARRPKLMKEFDRAARRAHGVLAHHLDNDNTLVDGLVRETRREYALLIPKLPYIGGARNPLTYNLTMSALFLAMYKVLKRHGKEPQEIGAIFYEIADRWYHSYPRFLRRLLGRLRFTRYYRRKLQKRAAESRKRRYPRDWVFTYVEGDGRQFDFGVDYTECAICKYYQQQDARDILPYLCPLDYPLSQAFGLGLERTMTLAEGAAMCDFRFKRGRPTSFRSPVA